MRMILNLAVGKLSGSSDRVLHDRLPSRAAQARLHAPGAHHAAAQSSQAALRACKHGRHGRAQAWTARMMRWTPGHLIIQLRRKGRVAAEVSRVCRKAERVCASP
jgi:hypothetical protein